MFPTREETVAALSRYRERLTPRFRIPTPAWDVVKWAWDKRNTYELAAELGIATPRTWLVGSAEELDGDRRRAAVRGQAGDQGALHLRHGDKAWRADTRAELDGALPRGGASGRRAAR